MEYFNKDMKCLKEGWKKFLQERLPNDEKVVKETHDENKRNVNDDFIESNFGLKTHHISKLDMRQFDGKDLITWILQMDQYFDVHDVQLLQKVHISSFFVNHLSPSQFS